MTTYARRSPAVRQRPVWLEDLTPREREVLDLVALGLSNGEIARELVVSMPTVKTHIANLLRKTLARDRVQLVVESWSSGLVGSAQRSALRCGGMPDAQPNPGALRARICSGGHHPGRQHQPMAKSPVR